MAARLVPFGQAKSRSAVAWIESPGLTGSVAASHIRTLHGYLVTIVLYLYAI